MPFFPMSDAISWKWSLIDVDDGAGATLARPSTPSLRHTGTVDHPQPSSARLPERRPAGHPTPSREPSPTSRRQPRPNRVVDLLRHLTLTLAWLLTLTGTATATLYALPHLHLADVRLTLAAAFIPYGVLAWLAATLLFALAARRRARLLALLTLAGLVLQLLWARPYWPSLSPSPIPDDAVTVMSLNLRCDGVGLEDVADAVARVRPDVLVLQGADPETREYFAADGWPGDEPNATFHPLQVDPECGKTVISDHPVTSVTSPGDERPVVRVDLPTGPLVVIPVDAPTPIDGLDVWDETLAQFERTAVNHLNEPTLLIGDFNAVREHAPIRRMLAAGLADAAEQAASGWRPTYPANRDHPPAVGIDHAFTSPQLRGLSVETFRAGINAHLGLTVQVASN